MRDILQNAGCALFGCNRNREKTPPRTGRDRIAQSFKTTVPDARSGKEGKNRWVSDSIPGEITQKISTCAICPKPPHKLRGRHTEYTSSQFKNEKLQKRVDSVDCMWYSNDNSLESGVVYGGGTDTPLRAPLVYFVECGEKWMDFMKNPFFSLAFFRLTEYTSVVNNLLSGGARQLL